MEHRQRVNHRAVLDVDGVLAPFGAGDESAFDLIVAEFSGLAWSIVWTVGLSPAQGEDAIQGMWLRLVQNLQRTRLVPWWRQNDQARCALRFVGWMNGASSCCSC